MGGGRAYLVQVVAFVALGAAFLAEMLASPDVFQYLVGPLLLVAGVATIIARRSILPAWSFSFIVSWIWEDELTQHRVVAWVVGIGLILSAIAFSAVLLLPPLLFG